MSCCPLPGAGLLSAWPTTTALGRHSVDFGKGNPFDQDFDLGFQLLTSMGSFSPALQMQEAPYSTPSHTSACTWATDPPTAMEMQHDRDVSTWAVCAGTHCSELSHHHWRHMCGSQFDLPSVHPRRQAGHVHKRPALHAKFAWAARTSAALMQTLIKAPAMLSGVCDATWN